MIKLRISLDASSRGGSSLGKQPQLVGWLVGCSVDLLVGHFRARREHNSGEDN